MQPRNPTLGDSTSSFWAEGYSDEGYPYVYNRVTQESRWGTMEENIAASPLQYSTLKSVVPRFDAKYYGASVRAQPAAQLRSELRSLPAC